MVFHPWAVSPCKMFACVTVGLNKTIEKDLGLAVDQCGPPLRLTCLGTETHHWACPLHVISIHPKCSFSLNLYLFRNTVVMCHAVPHTPRNLKSFSSISRKAFSENTHLPGPVCVLSSCCHLENSQLPTAAPFAHPVILGWAHSLMASSERVHGK